jgi:hypothetical protein
MATVTEARDMATPSCNRVTGIARPPVAPLAETSIVSSRGIEDQFRYWFDPARGRRPQCENLCLF